MRPLQPMRRDEQGTARFEANAIVRHLLDNGPFDMNHLARLDFSTEDWEQFAQLIGYSLSGFSELSYASDETVAAAELVFKSGTSESEARAAVLRKTLDELKDGIRQPIAVLFGIHPDDLNQGRGPEEE